MGKDVFDATEAVKDMIAACWKTQIIAQGVRFQIFDRLADGPASAPSLAGTMGANADAFTRILRALAALGLVEQLDPSRFQLTEMGTLLAHGSKHSLSGLALHTAEQLWRGYASLDISIRTGGPSVPSGAEHFAAMQEDNGIEADVFNRSMAEQSLRVGRAVAKAYDFSALQTVSDIGGGYGALLAGVLQSNPSLQGNVLDMPALKEKAEIYLAEQGVQDRAAYVGGNFFQQVPAGDCLMLKYIIHDWPDDKSRTILANCRAAIADSGRVLLIERLVPEIVTPSSDNAAVMQGDMAMMSVGGKERTESEYRVLLNDAGLDLRRIIGTDTEFSILDARPA